MSQSMQQVLSDGGSPTNTATAFSVIRDADGVGLGHMLASAFTPGFVERSGLTSSATHIEERPGLVHAVLDAAGAAERAIIHVGAPAPGQVLVTYSAAGVPTLLFGDGANTGYQVLKLEGPIDLAANLALTFAS